MKLSNLAKKLALVAIVGALANTALIACSHDSDKTTTTTTKDGTMTKTVRSKDSTYTTK